MSNSTCSLPTFLAAINELPRVHALGGNEQFLSLLVSVRVPEHYPRQRCSATRVVNYLFHYPLKQSYPTHGRTLQICSCFNHTYKRLPSSTHASRRSRWVLDVPIPFSASCVTEICFRVPYADHVLRVPCCVNSIREVARHSNFHV